MCLDEFAVEQRLARLSCYCLYHEECIVSYWRNPSSASPFLFPSFLRTLRASVLQSVTSTDIGCATEFCPTHRDLDTTPEVQMRIF